MSVADLAFAECAHHGIHAGVKCPICVPHRGLCPLCGGPSYSPRMCRRCYRARAAERRGAVDTCSVCGEEITIQADEGVCGFCLEERETYA